MFRQHSLFTLEEYVLTFCTGCLQLYLHCKNEKMLKALFDPSISAEPEPSDSRPGDTLEGCKMVQMI